MLLRAEGCDILTEKGLVVGFVMPTQSAPRLILSAGVQDSHAN